MALLASDSGARSCDLAGVANESVRPGVAEGLRALFAPSRALSPTAVLPFFMSPKATRFVVVGAPRALRATGVKRLFLSAPDFFVVVGAAAGASSKNLIAVARWGSAIVSGVDRSPARVREDRARLGRARGASQRRRVVFWRRARPFRRLPPRKYRRFVVSRVQCARGRGVWRQEGPARARARRQTRELRLARKPSAKVCDASQSLPRCPSTRWARALAELWARAASGDELGAA